MSYKRGSKIYLVAKTQSTYRVRAEIYPDNLPGWFGGKVLWGHDKSSLKEACELADKWVLEGKLPEGFDVPDVTYSYSLV